MKQSLFLLVLFCISLSYAQAECKKFCVSCKNNTDYICSQIGASCNCDSVIQETEAEETLKAAVKREDSLKIVEQTTQICENKETCSLSIAFISGRLQGIKERKPELPEDSSTILKADSSVTKETIPPQSEKCENFCNSCENNSKSSLCKQIEEECRCAFYAEQKLTEKEKQTEDTLAQMEAFINQRKNMAFFADSVLKLCSSDSLAFVLQVNLGKDYAINSIEKQKENPGISVENDSLEQAKQDSVDAMKAILTASERKIDSTKKVEFITPKEENSEQRIVKKATPKQEKEPLYRGVSFGFSPMSDYEEFGDRMPSSNDSYEASVGFLIRKRLARFFVFQTGLNAIYDYRSLYMDEGYYSYGKTEIDVTQNRISADIPLEFRFGPKGVFLSLLFNIRKPIYDWIDWDASYEERIGSSYNYDGYYYDDISNCSHGFSATSALEFFISAGLGFDITQHVAIAMNVLFFGLTTIDGEVYEDVYEDEFVAKFRLELAF